MPLVYLYKFGLLEVELTMEESLRINVRGFDSLSLKGFHSLIAGMFDGLMLWT